MFKQFKSLVENLYSSTIKILRCDGGGEFKPVIELAHQQGIEVQVTCSYTSPQNGRVERKHRHIVETGLTLLAQAQMSLNYWREAFHTATHLINQMPLIVNNDECPFALLKGYSLDYTCLRTFGSVYFPYLQPYQQHKFDYHTTKCVFMGYSDCHKGYWCLSSIGRIVISDMSTSTRKNLPTHLFSTKNQRPRQPTQV